MPNKLILIDANHYMHRAYHALPKLTTKDGEEVGAVYGFARVLLKIFKRFDPKYLAICWDKKPTIRLELFPEYKAHRPPTDDALISQMKLAKALSRTWQLTNLEADGYEADDLIAAIAKQAGDEGVSSIVITSDKDLLQLVNKHTRVYMEHRDQEFDRKTVKSVYGFGPELLIDYLAITGDAADNIKGVPGIGDKRAKDLIARYGDADRIINAAVKNDPAIPEKIKENIVSSKEKISKNKKLISLCYDAPVKWDSKSFTFKPDMKNQEFQALVGRLGFASIIAQSSQAKTGKTNDNGSNVEELVWGEDEVIAHDIKSYLHAHPRTIKKLKGEIFDLKLLSWLDNPSQESFELDWILSTSGKTSMSEAAHHFKTKLESKGKWDLYKNVELPLTLILFAMEQDGVRVDKAYLTKLKNAWEKKRTQLRKEIIEECHAPEDLNLNSPKQLGVLLYEKLNLPKTKKTKTGYSTNEEVLKRLSGLHPAIVKILEVRELSKLISTYAQGLLDLIDPQTRRIHATFHQEGTQTGRLSCTNPNLQNIPIRTPRGLEIRKSFIPKDNYRFLSLDYSQIDLRSLAHLSEDKDLIEFFTQNKDIHEEAARKIFELKGEESVSNEMRRKAKAINFGVIYGMGPKGLSRELGITQDEAKNFIELYFTRFKGVKTWRENIIKQAGLDQSVSTLLGHTRPLPNINSSRDHLREFSERVAVNTPVQGTSADIIKMAMIELSKFLNKLKTKMIVQVHDDILFEGPENEIKQHKPELINIMEHAMKLKVPLIVHSKTGENWRDLE
ncbi:DNA polymerase [Elusimicrobiota bacterium]